MHILCLRIKKKNGKMKEINYLFKSNNLNKNRKNNRKKKKKLKNQKNLIKENKINKL